MQVPKVAAKISAPFTVETEISKLHHPPRAGGHEIVSIKTIAQRVTDGDRILVTSNEEKKKIFSVLLEKNLVNQVEIVTLNDVHLKNRLWLSRESNPFLPKIYTQNDG